MLASRLRPDRTARAPGGRGLLAVQWRSEDWQYNVPERAVGFNASEPDSLTQCAVWAAMAIRRALQEHNLSDAFLATDLRAGASGSYHGPRRRPARRALKALEARVPELSNARRRQLVAAIPDRGVQACLEAAVCTSARFLLATTERCTDCERARRCSKMSSAFGRAAVSSRRATHRPSAPLF